MLWKENWPQTRERLIQWWHHQGLVIHLTAAREEVREGLTPPPPAPDVESGWLDPQHRLQQAEYDMARQDFMAESFPFLDTQIGPGTLNLLLGSIPRFAPNTVWYYPCITDPETYGPIQFQPDGDRWWQAQMAIVDIALANARGRYLVSIPDFVESLDTLAALRGNTETLFDLIERPAWVCEKMAEINQAYFAAYEPIYQKVRDEEGGSVFSAFRVWGPGKTAKVQCDFSAMISPKMFRQFVVPSLEEQCRWLDYSMYHLDGTNACQHLDLLLAIDSLDAVEWTPQAGKPSGGSPDWFAMYRRIKAAGKSVQAVDVDLEDLIPLLDAVGPEGMYIITNGNPHPRDEVEATLKRLEPYYPSIQPVNSAGRS